MTIADGFALWLGKFFAELALIVGFLLALFVLLFVLEWRADRRRRKP